MTERISRSRQESGFTLIELLIVVSILAMTLTFIVPRLAGKDEADLRSGARGFLYAARTVSDDALFRKEKQVMEIDIRNGRYWREEGKARTLPDGVVFKKVTIRGKVVTEEKASISFFPSGLRDDAEIVLEGRGRTGRYTIRIPPLGERFVIDEIS